MFAMFVASTCAVFAADIAGTFIVMGTYMGDYATTCHPDNAAFYDAYHSKNLFVLVICIAHFISGMWLVCESFRVQQLAVDARQFHDWAAADRGVWFGLACGLYLFVALGASVWIHARDTVCDGGMDPKKAVTLRAICIHDIGSETAVVVYHYVSLLVVCWHCVGGALFLSSHKTRKPQQA